MNEQQVSEREIRVLEAIYRSREAIRQRNIAQIVDLSLGMTNAIVKRLTQKGLLEIRKVNNRNVHYIVSPEGVNVIAKKSYRYVKRTIKNVILYKQAIENLIRNAHDHAFKDIALVGKSDIDFIIEHCCSKQRLSFSMTDSITQCDGKFFICGEDIEPSASREGHHTGQNVVFLRELLLKRTG